MSANGNDCIVCWLQEKMSRGSAMLNRKHGSFFNAINAEATRECWDGVHAARVWSSVRLASTADFKHVLLMKYQS